MYGELVLEFYIFYMLLYLKKSSYFFIVDWTSFWRSLINEDDYLAATFALNNDSFNLMCYLSVDMICITLVAYDSSCILGFYSFWVMIEIWVN